VSQSRTYEYLNRLRPGYHTFHLLPRYSHLDVFMGANAARDTFPLIAAELEREAGRRTVARSARASAGSTANLSEVS